MCIRITIILTVWSVLVSCGWSRDLYINNVMGDDRNDGSTPAPGGMYVGPYRTVTRALKAARKGDRLILANTGEAYRESITLQGGRHSGFARSPFELVGNGAVLDGTARVPLDGWSHFEGNIFRFRPPKMSFQMLYLKDKPASRRTVGHAEEILGLEPLEWCLFDGYIYFSVEPNRLPQSYELAYAALPVGITLYEVRHVIIRDVILQGFQLDGVNAHDGVVQTSLVGLNCRGNGRSGISVGGASRVQVESCLVGNNGTAQFRCEGFSHTQLIGCDLLDNTAPRIVRDGGAVEERK